MVPRLPGSADPVASFTDDKRSGFPLCWIRQSWRPFLIRRRRFLLAGAALVVLATGGDALWSTAFAKDGDDRGDDRGGDSRDERDSRDDRDDRDDRDGDSGRGRGRGRGGDDDERDGGDRSLSSSEAGSVIRSGKALPLREALERLEERYDGRVINVELQQRSGRLVYRFKLREDDGKVRTVSMDAASGRFLSLFGLF